MDKAKMVSPFSLDEECMEFLTREGVGDVQLTPLCLMVYRNQISGVMALMNYQRVDVNQKLENGRTALFIAVEMGYDGMASLLIHKGANVNDRDNKGLTPLHLACYFRHTTIAKLLISEGADVNADSEKLGTPIMGTTVWSNPHDKNDPIDVLTELLKHGANVNDKCEAGISPLHYAVKESNVRMVKLLIESKADVNVRILDMPLINVAIEKNAVQIVEAFLKVENLDVNMRDRKQNTSLLMACYSEKINMVKLLMKRNYDVNAQNIEGLTPLHMALTKQNYPLAEVLLKNEKVDVNLCVPYQNTALHFAFMFSRIPGIIDTQLKEPVIKTIIDKTENVNLPGDTGTPLILAIKLGPSLEIVKYLIEKGADVNLHYQFKAFSSVKISPLHFACLEKNKKDIVKLLLSHGANVNDWNLCGFEPLELAIMTGNFEKVKELQNYGAHIHKEHLEMNEPEFKITSPVLLFLLKSTKFEGLPKPTRSERNKISHLLRLNLEFLKNVRSNKYEEVKQNIKDGASVNVSCPRCASALIYASWKGFEEIVDVLLEHGANVNFKSDTGYTALHMACRFHTNDVIVRKLLRHGAYYNLRDDKKHKTPGKHARDGKQNNLENLFKLIDSNFEAVKKKSEEIIPRLVELKNKDKEEYDFLKIVRNVKGENLASLARAGKSHCAFLRELDKVLSSD